MYAFWNFKLQLTVRKQKQCGNSVVTFRNMKRKLNMKLLTTKILGIIYNFVKLVNTRYFVGFGAKSSRSQEYQSCKGSLYFCWLHEVDAFVYHSLARNDQQGSLSR